MDADLKWGMNEAREFLLEILDKLAQRAIKI
jgi:hypothetical protein